MDKFYRMAWKLSFDSSYPERNKRLGAIVVKGGCVINANTNQLHKHAERRCLRPHQSYTNATLYVARSNGLISRPCPECFDVIKASGVKCMVYINKDGNLVKEYIRR